MDAEREIRIPIGGDEEIRGMLSLPELPVEPGILLAHGAGAGQEHPWMVHMRRALAASGHPTMTFDYRYTARGRKAPDRMPVLLTAHEAAASALACRVGSVVFAGKSMGSRVGSHLVADLGWPAVALVSYGYPLVPMGTREPREVAHLERIMVPQLFFSGTRDRLSPPDLMRDVVASLPDATLIVVEEGNHSFEVPKRSGLTLEQVLDGVASDTAAFIAERVQAGGGR